MTVGARRNGFGASIPTPSKLFTSPLTAIVRASSENASPTCNDLRSCINAITLAGRGDAIPNGPLGKAVRAAQDLTPSKKCRDLFTAGIKLVRSRTSNVAHTTTLNNADEETRNAIAWIADVDCKPDERKDLAHRTSHVEYRGGTIGGNGEERGPAAAREGACGRYRFEREAAANVTA